MVLVTFPTNFIKNSEEFKKGRRCIDNMNRWKMYTGDNTTNSLLHPDTYKMPESEDRTKSKGCSC